LCFSKVFSTALGDADGVSSAAVVKAALAGEYEAVKVYFTHPVDLAKDFEAFAEGNVYVVDVAIDDKTVDEMRKAFRSYGGEGCVYRPPPALCGPAGG
jgi:single-stranded-DNA-specific exonuclease